MKRIIAALLPAIVLLASCSQYETTPSGLKYKIKKGGSSQTLKQGQYVKFNIEYKIPPKDTVINTTYGHIPGYMMVDTTRAAKHSFLEIITKTAPGDKVEFVMNVDTLKKLGLLQYNEVFHERDMINGRVEILKVFANAVEAQADLQNEQKAEKDREVKDLKNELNKKGIKTQELPSGVLVQVDNAGEGQKADTGYQAKVMYSGKFLDGKEFDSNMKPNGQPLDVIIGTGKVIPGLDEGLRVFGKGGKGKIYIPAMLGYGDRGSPPVIPQYSNLVFEVQVVDVTPAPKQVPGPAFPGMQQQQQPQQ